mgnify:CR=1 FL=1
MDYYSFLDLVGRLTRKEGPGSGGAQPYDYYEDGAWGLGESVCVGTVRGGWGSVCV